MLMDETLPPKSTGIDPWFCRLNADRTLSRDLRLLPDMIFSLVAGIGTYLG
jgi:hypothetical protein